LELSWIRGEKGLEGERQRKRLVERRRQI